MTSPQQRNVGTYDEYLELPEFRDRGWRLVRENRLDPDLALGWSLHMPYELGDGHVVDAPGPVHTPKKGLKKMFGTDMAGTYRQMLANSWGVHDRDETLGTVQNLLEYAGDPGYRAMLPALRQLLTVPVGQRPGYLASIAEMVRGAVDDSVTDEQVVAEVNRVVGPFLVPESVLALPAALPPDTVGWDTARALRVLWMAHGAGFVTEQDAEPFVRAALDLTRQVYGSWREHADGFLVGRAQWVEAVDDSSLEYAGGMATALHHPDSPWVLTPLR